MHGKTGGPSVARGYCLAAAAAAAPGSDVSVGVAYARSYCCGPTEDRHRLVFLPIPYFFRF